LGVGRIIEAGVFSSQDDWVQEIVNEYYDNPSWFELIGIPKAKRSTKNLQFIKAMVDRFLGYFGLESKQGKRNENGQRWYTVQVPQSILSPSPSISYINNAKVTGINQSQPKGELNYLTDIDICLARRAEIAIADAQEISFCQIASKAEEQARIDREWMEKHQSELNKRVLENSLSVEIVENVVPEVKNTANSTDEWMQPESILYVTGLLDYCNNAEMVADLRRSDIPPNIFRIASRHLPIDKREQIRDWVLQDNELPKPPI
jgi:hypothetical protein